MAEFVTRFALPSDFEQLRRIALESPRPATAEELYAEIWQRKGVSTYAAVETEAHDLVGFAVARQTGRRRILVERLEVAPRWRRRGVGRLLVERLRERMARGGRNELFAYVPERALGGQLFLAALGWRADETIRKGYFPATREDAYVFRLRGAG